MIGKRAMSKEYSDVASRGHGYNLRSRGRQEPSASEEEEDSAPDGDVAVPALVQHEVSGSKSVRAGQEFLKVLEGHRIGGRDPDTDSSDGLPRDIGPPFGLDVDDRDLEEGSVELASGPQETSSLLGTGTSAGDFSDQDQGEGTGEPPPGGATVAYSRGDAAVEPETEHESGSPDDEITFPRLGEGEDPSERVQSPRERLPLTRETSGGSDGSDEGRQEAVDAAQHAARKEEGRRSGAYVAEDLPQPPPRKVARKRTASDLEEPEGQGRQKEARAALSPVSEGASTRNPPEDMSEYGNSHQEEEPGSAMSEFEPGSELSAGQLAQFRELQEELAATQRDRTEQKGRVADLQVKAQELLRRLEEERRRTWEVKQDARRERDQARQAGVMEGKERERERWEHAMQAEISVWRGRCQKATAERDILGFHLNEKEATIKGLQGQIHQLAEETGKDSPGEESKTSLQDVIEEVGTPYVSPYVPPSECLSHMVPPRRVGIVTDLLSTPPTSMGEVVEGVEPERPSSEERRPPCDGPMTSHEAEPVIGFAPRDSPTDNGPRTSPVFLEQLESAESRRTPSQVSPEVARQHQEAEEAWDKYIREGVQIRARALRKEGAYIGRVDTQTLARSLLRLEDQERVRKARLAFEVQQQRELVGAVSPGPRFTLNVVKQEHQRQQIQAELGKDGSRFGADIAKQEDKPTGGATAEGAQAEERARIREIVSRRERRSKVRSRRRRKRGALVNPSAVDTSMEPDHGTALALAGERGDPDESEGGSTSPSSSDEEPEVPVRGLRAAINVLCKPRPTPHLKNFGGKPDEDPKEWLSRLENEFGCQHIYSLSTQFGMAYRLLEGVALAWFDSQREKNYHKKKGPFSTWKRFKEAFLERFTPKETLGVRYRLWEETKMAPDEDPDDYINRVMLQGHRLGADEPAVLRTLLRGMNSRYRSKVVMRNPQTVEDVMTGIRLAKAVTNEEDVENMRSLEVMSNLTRALDDLPSEIQKSVKAATARALRVRELEAQDKTKKTRKSKLEGSFTPEEGPRPEVSPEKLVKAVISALQPPATTTSTTEMSARNSRNTPPPPPTWEGSSPGTVLVPYNNGWLPVQSGWNGQNQPQPQMLQRPFRNNLNRNGNPPSRATITCYACGQLGHYRRECPNLRNAGSTGSYYGNKNYGDNRNDRRNEVPYGGSGRDGQRPQASNYQGPGGGSFSQDPRSSTGAQA